MLPANLAKGRTAARGLGELLMVGPGLHATLRYSPYSVPPSTNTALVAMSQPQPPPPPPAMSLTGSPLATIAAAAAAANGVTNAATAAAPQLQFIGLDQSGAAAAGAPNVQLNLNQLLAGQLSLTAAAAGCKPGNLSLGFVQQQPQQQPQQQQQQQQPSFSQFQGGLGYNVSDLLNLQGLTGLQPAGLQVPVGL